MTLTCENCGAPTSAVCEDNRTGVDAHLPGAVVCHKCYVQLMAHMQSMSEEEKNRARLEEAFQMARETIRKGRAS